MKKLLLTAALLAAQITHGATLTDLLGLLTADSDVLAARVSQPSVQYEGFADIGLAKITYLEITGGTVTANTVGVIVVAPDGQTENAYWLGGLPSVLEEAPAAETYITARSVPFTAAQVEGFANDAWRGIKNASARDIRDFSVRNIDSQTVEVTGWFQIADESWNNLTYYIHIVDVNGSYAANAQNTNIEFEQRETAAQ
jgi:hypothetical protein